jgi:beta-glucosidase/6-phospho-beta-glucosidase/beta-galactosidase/ABC-type amino acid transport substrate-binding protein
MMRARSGASGKSRRRTIAPPGPLRFGVANSDHQCEAFDPKRPDLRDAWEAAAGKVTRGRATDFWNRFAEDVRNARALGCDLFRFSISWARVEPSPGRFSSKAIAHYRSLIETIREAGMQPLVTLHHFTWPRWLEELGGLAAPAFPKLFARYAAVAARRIGPAVPYWDTINEPTVLIFGYIKPWWEKEYFFPPGSTQDIPMEHQIGILGKLIRNLFLAHTAARREIRRVNPRAMVGANPAMLGLPGWTTWILDRLMTRVSTPARLGGNLGRIAERGFLVRRNVDIVLGALSVTPQRSEMIDFSQPYLQNGYALLARAPLPRAASRRKGFRIGVVATTTAETAAAAGFRSARIVRFRTAAAALDALDRGAVNAFLTDRILARGIQVRVPSRYQVVGRPQGRDSYAVGVRRGSAELLKAVNRAVIGLRESGSLEKSARIHFSAEGREYLPGPADGGSRGAWKPGGGRASDRPGQHQRRRSELRRIQSRGFLVAGVRDDVPGLCSRDPGTGEWSGVEVDLCRAIAQELLGDPRRVRFRRVRTHQRIPLLRSVFRIFDPLIRFLAILTSVANSNWWHLGMAGRLDPFLCPRSCVGAQDYAGLDYYWGVPTLRLRRLVALFDALTKGQYGRAPVWPGGLGRKLRYVSGLFPGTPLMILENGCVDAADGFTRSEYLRRHVAEVRRSRRAGIDVAAYVVWSITSNRELGAPSNEESDFGLFHIDLDTDPRLRRKRTSSAAAYRDLIRGE